MAIGWVYVLKCFLWLFAVWNLSSRNPVRCPWSCMYVVCHAINVVLTPVSAVIDSTPKLSDVETVKEFLEKHQDNWQVDYCWVQVKAILHSVFLIHNKLWQWREGLVLTVWCPFQWNHQPPLWVRLLLGRPLQLEVVSCVLLSLSTVSNMIFTDFSFSVSKQRAIASFPTLRVFIDAYEILHPHLCYPSPFR